MTKQVPLRDFFRAKIAKQSENNAPWQIDNKTCNKQPDNMLEYEQAEQD